MPLRNGARLAHYDVVSLLGAGGMGEVYRATDTRLHRDVALKVLPFDAASDPARLERFTREARAVAALNHPNIVTIYSVEESNEVPFFTMELVEGRTLDSVLAGEQLSLERFLALAEPLADAVAAAHAAGITHRDLKPQNVMIGRDGRLKVLDFGLAKFDAPAPADQDRLHRTTMLETREGTLLGTVPYMSPEQVEGKPVDARSDVFSLGAIYYQMVTGRRPFHGDSSLSVAASILRDAPSPVARLAPSLPTALHQVIDRCLAKDPGARYQDAAALCQALRDVTGTGAVRPLSLTGVAPVAAPPAPAGPPLVGRLAERNRLVRHLHAASGGAGALVLLGGEPGVGKTRLSEHLLDEARRDGMLALKGHCYEAGTAPFSPFVELVEQMLRDLPAPVVRQALGTDAPEMARLVPAIRRVWEDLSEPSQLAPEQHRRILFQSFVDVLRRLSALTPLVLLLDDLHWADDATVGLLQHITPHLTDMRVLILGTYRDVESDLGQPFERAMGALVRERHVFRVPVRRLPQTAVAELLKSLGGSEPPEALVKAIFDVTEGNAFFVGEVFQHLSEEGQLFDAAGAWRVDRRIDARDVPEGVRFVVGRRLARLSEATPSILTLAAVVGRRFDLPLVEALSPVSGDAFLLAIEEAESARLIGSEQAGRETRYVFTHELIRHTLLSALSLPRRQRLEASVAKAIETVYGASARGHSASIAHHLYEAGPDADPAETIRYLVRASDEAIEAGAIEGALAHIERALTLVDDRQIRVTLLWKRGLARRGLGGLLEAIEDWQTALDLNEGHVDATPIAQLCQELAHSYAWTGQPLLGIAAAQRGLADLDAAPSANRCRLLGALGWNLSVACDFASAEPVVREALAMADAIGGDALKGELLLVSSWHDYLCMRRAAQADACRTAVVLLRPTRDLAKLGEALGNIQMASIQLGRPGDVVRNEDETRILAERLGRFDIKVHQLYSEAFRDWLISGDLDRLDVGLRQVADVAGAWGWLVEACQAQALLWRGRLDATADQARTSLSHEPPISTHTGLGWGMVFLGECVAGRRESALAVLEAHAAGLPRPGVRNTLGSWCALFKVVEGLALLGATEPLPALHPLVVESIANDTVVTFDGAHLLETLAGIAAAAGRQWGLAETHHQAAVRRADAMPFIVAQAEARYWYARLLADRAAADDGVQASALLNGAIPIYRRIGMPWYAARAEALLADLR